MSFDDLEKGSIFTIDGKYYEAYIIGERIVLAYELRKNVFAKKLGKPELERIPDPNDLAGDKYLTDAFSDLRFNANNMTALERQYEQNLKDLL